MKYLFFFILLPILTFSQDYKSFLSYSLESGIYDYFDSVGIKASDEKFLCDCAFEADTKFWFFVTKEEVRSKDLDTLLLEWPDEGVAESLIRDYNKKISVNLINLTKKVYLETEIKRLSVRFNFFHWMWKVRYKVKVTYSYNPYEK
jgi:hypothetical protein